MLICANSPEAPGDLTQVKGDACCARFQARRGPVVRLAPPPPPDANTKYITLTRGKFAMVDAADFEWLNQFKWYALASAHEGTYYACRHTKGGGTILMHREIMQTPPGMVVDHIDSNGLNNHRANMRNCTQAQNRYNTRAYGKSCPFKGVRPKGDKWEAKIKHRGQWYNLGLYDSPSEAARARDRKALELYGEYAWLNLPGRVINLSGSCHAQTHLTARLQIRHAGSTVWE